MDLASFNPVDISRKKAALIAGVSLLLMAIIAPIANFGILEGLIIEGDVIKTFFNIQAAEGQFRLSICLFILVAILDIIVAWALYIYLKNINKSLSLLTAWFRIIYATLLIAALFNLIQVLQLIKTAEYLNAFESSRLFHVTLLINNFQHVWSFSMIIFGFHLLILGFLLLKAAYMRKILGGLVMIAGLGYIIDGFGKIISSNYSTEAAMFTFLGELVLIVWLLGWGWKIKKLN